MKYKKHIGLAAVAFGLFAVPSVHANNITIFDSVAGGGFSGGGAGQGNEDNEVEAGAVTGQIWDLEAFELNGTSLSLWGGFDFENGEAQGGNVWGSGDIFIDVNGDAVWGNDIDISGSFDPTSNSSYNYDYVISFDRSGPQLTGNYSVFEIDGSAELTRTYDWGGDKFDWSNPFTYVRDDQNAAITTGAYTYVEDSATNPLGLLGDWHNVLTVDLGFLGSLDDILVHFTIECGNDGIKGQTTSVPDGGLTLCLFGAGLAALGLVRRRSN